MIRMANLALAVLLAILAVMALSEQGTIWLTYLEGVAAFLAVGAAILIPARARPFRAMTPPFLLAMLMFASFAIGLQTGASYWLCWWNFVVGLAFLATTLGGAVQLKLPLLRTPKVI